MKLKNLFYLLMVLPFLFIYTGCSKSDDNPAQPETKVNESQVLAEYFEANGDFVNISAPALITASDVHDLQLAKPDKLYIIDIRSSADFQNKGHIQGAVNVALKDVVTHVKGINATSFEKIVIVCYSAQTAGMATTFLRLLGYSNVFALKWGMSSWNSSACTSWSLSAVGNNFTGFVTTATAKNAAGDLPTISTGKTTGKEILEERINQLLATTDPFGDIKIAWNTVTGSASNYYIVNYWPENHYSLGHIPGAIQYTPKVDFKLSTNLKTLPTNKPVVIYCYTGQTSAQVATFLKLLGYDAKTLLYGTQVMNYDWMGTNGLSQWKQSEVKEYSIITGQ